MKKIFFLILILILIIPSSVQASGVFDFVSLVITEKNTLRDAQGDKSLDFDFRQDDSKDYPEIHRTFSPCDFGFKFNYENHSCEKVVVPADGVLNEDGISVRCEVGYRLDYEKNVCNKVIIPAYAQLSGTGDDFSCDRDFRRVGDTCEDLKLPANSHIAAGGNDFDCNTGYKKEGEKCVEAVKPANAKFFPNSDEWYCENSYVNVDQRCEPLKVPSNGRAADTGTFIYCLPGHKIADNGKDCEQIRVPENAEANWIGSWTCKVGYKYVGSRNEFGMTGTCQKIENVEHGKLLADSGFYCEPHFKRNETDRTCVPVILPQNAQWDEASLDDWRCNQGYVKNLSSHSCDPFKLPEHAFWTGVNAWECDAGYEKKLDSGQWTTGRCEKVSIPEHGFASQSFEKWDCENGYIKNYREKRCDKL